VAFEPSASLPHTTVAAEDYLEKIEELIRRKGYARVVDIAAELRISQASVTAMVQRLDAEGLVKYEKYRGMVLTSAGQEVAQRIAHRHQLLTDFLRVLGVDEKVIYNDVEGMEHHISPDTFRAIEALTRYLEKNPTVVAKARTGKK
jgi:Mn-dependent DtxR family transcriptional regulator